MQYCYRDFNIPCFNYQDVEKQIKIHGDKEFKNKKEINEEFKKYKNNKDDKAYVLGFINKNLAKEITGIYYPLYIIALNYCYFFTFQDGYVVTF